MNVAHVEASQIVPLFKEPLGKEDECEEVVGNINRENQFENFNQRKEWKECQRF